MWVNDCLIRALDEAVIALKLGRAETLDDNLVGLVQGVLIWLEDPRREFSSRSEESALAAIPTPRRSAGALDGIFPPLWDSLHGDTKGELIGEINGLYPGQDLMAQILSSERWHADFLKARLGNWLGIFQTNLSLLIAGTYEGQGGEEEGILQDIQKVLPYLLDLLDALFGAFDKDALLARHFWGVLDLKPELQQAIDEVRISGSADGNPKLRDKIGKPVRDQIVELGHLIDSGMILHFGYLTSSLVKRRGGVSSLATRWRSLRESSAQALRTEASQKGYDWGRLSEWDEGVRYAERFNGCPVFAIGSPAPGELAEEILRLVAEEHQRSPGSGVVRAFLWHLGSEARRALPAFVRSLLSVA